MTPLSTSYDTSSVALSLLIAILAGYVFLDLARRVRFHRGSAAFAWGLGGSLALGSGIWAMHFVGMVSWRVPIVLGYAILPTIVSWVAAVLVSGVALAIATRESLGPRTLALGALVMGAGICTMHYIGMAAIDVVPGFVWNRWLVAASVLVAVIASGVALRLFFLLRHLGQQRGAFLHGPGALAVGLAISGMHYTGMAAASLQAGTVCTSAGSLSSAGIAPFVATVSIALLLIAIATSLIDARSRQAADRLSESLVDANEQLHAANAELQRLGSEDPLTGLPNRPRFDDRLAQAVKRHERSAMDAAGRGGARAQLAVFFIDLDGFKPVNDSLGHAAGDRVLLAVASRLLRVARASDMVARVGGDEFLMLAEEVGSVADAVDIAVRALSAIAEPLAVAGQQVEISGSIGIVVHPDAGKPDKLIAQADSAMYVAKRGGGNDYAVFESAMEIDALSRLTLLNDLRHAAARGEMQLHYQPKVDCKRGRITGVEALLRWTHPVRGPIGPAEFIPIAERHGVMTTLGRWVVEEACRQIAAWADVGLRMRVAINVSVHQLREADLVGHIEATLRRHAVDPAQLLCEITESVAMKDIRATQTTFEGLGRIGVFLSIDDFGTGYSSLSYLRKLPARQLKIDQSFIDDLETSSDARAVVDAVIRLAHALGLSVVAEGVETAGQRDILGELGCDELQGYFHARPMPAAQLLEWAHGNRPAGSAEFAPSMLQEGV